MTTDPTAPLIEVTQEDSDAAHALALQLTSLTGEVFLAIDSGPITQAFARHRIAATLPAQGDAGEIVSEIVELAKRDIARTQTDFLGRMGQALCQYESAFDDHPDGDLPEDVKQEADDNIAALAGLALAQLAMLRAPADPAAALRLPASDAQRDGK